jgi:hypothetical protein
MRLDEAMAWLAGEMNERLKRNAEAECVALANGRTLLLTAVPKETSEESVEAPTVRITLSTGEVSQWTRCQVSDETRQFLSGYPPYGIGGGAF